MNKTQYIATFFGLLKNKKTNRLYTSGAFDTQDEALVGLGVKAPMQKRGLMTMYQKTGNKLTKLWWGDLVT